MSRRAMQERAAWRVSIPAHTIVRPNGRAYEVPERVATRFEESEASAIAFAVQEAHIGAGVPPWRPYIRETTRLARAERCYAVAAAGRA